MKNSKESGVLYCNKKMQDIYNLECQIDYEKHTELEVKKLRNGIVHPLGTNVNEPNTITGGVTDKDFGFVELSLTKRVSPKNIPGVTLKDWFSGPLKDSEVDSIKYVDEDVVFLGVLSGHYGHFILEGLSRLWYFLNPENVHLKAVYVSEVSNNKFINFFSLFGLKDDNIIEVTEPTRFRNVVVPEQSIRLHDFYHIFYKETIERIKESVESGLSKKVFFSKKLTKSGRSIGDLVIEKVFKKNGYEVFYPEKMNLYETVSVLKGCDDFVAISGTTIHNAIFLNDQKSTICLNRSEHFHPIQIMIDRMKDLNATYIDVFIISTDAAFGNKPCFVAITKHLKRYFIAKGMIFSTSKTHIISFLYLFKYFAFSFYIRLVKLKGSINGVFK
jgi:hypothetical protein